MNRIKVVLAERGISAKAIADALGNDCSPAILSYISSGKVLPTRALLKRMCEVLSCEPEEIFEANELDLLSCMRDGAGVDGAQTENVSDELLRMSKRLIQIADRYEISFKPF